jgi:hypothetical protein
LYWLYNGKRQDGGHGKYRIVSFRKKGRKGGEVHDGVGNMKTTVSSERRLWQRQRLMSPRHNIYGCLKTDNDCINFVQIRKKVAIFRLTIFDWNS